MTVSERIRSAREKRGLSQYQLANKLKNLNQSQLSKIETGKRKICAADLIEISDALEIPVGVLIGEEDT